MTNTSTFNSQKRDPPVSSRRNESNWRMHPFLQTHREERKYFIILPSLCKYLPNAYCNSKDRWKNKLKRTVLHPSKIEDHLFSIVFFNTIKRLIEHAPKDTIDSCWNFFIIIIILFSNDHMTQFILEYTKCPLSLVENHGTYVKQPVWQNT